MREEEGDSSSDAESFREMTGKPCAEWELECEGTYPLKPGTLS